MTHPIIPFSAALPVTRDGRRTPRTLAAQAGREVLEATGITPDAVITGNMLSGILSHQQQLGALVASDLGLHHAEAWTVEAACASGAAALLNGIRLLRSGDARSVLVIGVEAMTHVPIEAATAGLATASDREDEGSRGATFVTLNANLMERYLERFALDRDALMPLSLLAHHNALSNPLACLRKKVTPDDYLSSRLLHGPLRLYDASPTCDGAAALLMTTPDVAATLPADACVRVEGWGLRTEAPSLARRSAPLGLRAASESMAQALRRSERSLQQLDLFELHDAYTIMAALTLESCGISEPGRAPADAAAGRFDLDGELPISTFGGLKSRGHPVGATGVYQVHEVRLQLTGQAGDAQVRGAGIGATQNIGGTGSTVVTLILAHIRQSLQPATAPGLQPP